MKLVLFAPLRAGLLIWAVGPNDARLTVCAKLTFALVPGAEARLTTPLELHEELPDREGKSSRLHAPSDYAPYKPSAEILLVGTTRALRRAALTLVTPRLRVDAYDETADPSGVPEPFAPLPAAARAHLLGLGEEALRFGHDLAQRPAIAPQGFDFAFFNAAPYEQQLPVLGPAPHLILEHLHPDHEHFDARLPMLAPHAIHSTPDGASAPLALRPDTLWIDVQRNLATLTYRGTSALSALDPSAVGTVTVGIEGYEAAPAPTPRGGRSATLVMSDGPEEPRAETITMRVGAHERAKAAKPLPFSSPGDPSSPLALPTPPAARPPRSAPGSTMVAKIGDARRPITPFTPAPPPPPVVEILDEPTEIASLPISVPAPVPVPVPAPAPAPVAAPPPPLRAPIDLSPARCARLRARIDRDPARKDETLAAEGVALADFERSEAPCLASIRAAVARGSTAALRAYDEAYVGELEALRGPLGPEDYARILVSVERRRPGPACEALGLPVAALPRVERIWIRRLAQSPAQAAAVRQAVGLARAEDA